MNPAAHPEDPPGVHDSAPFRAFDEHAFIASAASDRLSRILATNGGSYALSGPRGGGKSWLMMKALADVKRGGGLWLWYPSPSNYNAFDFLSTLADNFANQVERKYRPDRLKPTLASSPFPLGLGSFLICVGVVLAGSGEAANEVTRSGGIAMLILVPMITLSVAWRSWTKPPKPTPPSWRHRMRQFRQSWLQTLLLSESQSTEEEPKAGHAPRDPRAVRRSLMRRVWRVYGAMVLAYLFIGAIVLGAVLYGLGVGTESLQGSLLRQLLLAITAYAAGLALLYATLRGIAAEQKPERLLTREAVLLRERIRYSSRTKEGTEVSAKGTVTGIVGGFKSARERELVERPTTVASLIHDFRALAERAGQVSKRVVIAIDELDKIADIGAVRALLRDIKGIFEIENVFFLVSVSDEAARALKLGGLAERDELNSSFYSVIEVPPMSPQFLASFLESRGLALNDEVSLALALLARNNPRETLRSAEACGAVGGSVNAAVVSTLGQEVRAFRFGAMTSSAPGAASGLSDHEREGLANALADHRFVAQSFAQSAAGLLDHWEPAWAGPYWRAHLQESWRRLLVRLYVAAALLEEDTVLGELDQILQALDESSIVARQLIDQRRSTMQTPGSVDTE